MEEVIKSYKGFNRDMTCNPEGVSFQYEEGKEYEEDNAEACECGFHACEMPLDVFSYYPPGTSVYHEVEQSGKISRKEDDSKVASTKIKIGARLDIAGPLRQEITGPLRQEITGPLRQEIAGPLRQDIAGPLRQDIAGPLRQEIAGPLRQEIPGPLRAEENLKSARMDLRLHVEIMSKSREESDRSS